MSKVLAAVLRSIANPEGLRRDLSCVICCPAELFGSMVVLLAEAAAMEADRSRKVAIAARNDEDFSDGQDEGLSPILTSRDDRSGQSSTPSGSDMSSVVVDYRSSPTAEEAAKQSPRKVTLPEPGVSSYQALEEGLHADRADQSEQRSSMTMERTSGRGRHANGPPAIITMKSPTAASKGSNSSSGSKKAASLRRGKWTVEEEAYVARVIQDFNYGYLDAPAGTTLRTYLSEKLKCDPMRITKKFTGDACIGKRVFHPAVRSPENTAAIDLAQVGSKLKTIRIVNHPYSLFHCVVNPQAELDALERRWRLRLEMQQRESAKKAAASAAVAAASAAGGMGVVTSEAGPNRSPANPIAQTASWLDRAKSALKETTSAPSQDHDYDEEADLEDQMHEVERLIHEGPYIQQKSAGLPQMLDVPEGSQSPANGSVASGEPEPADKRMKTAEDAEALVGFLRSVRASAASGTQL